MKIEERSGFAGAWRKERQRDRSHAAFSPEKNLKNKQQQQATKLEQGNPPKHTPFHVEDGNPDRVPVFDCILQEKTKNDRIYAVIRDKSAGGERA